MAGSSVAANDVRVFGRGMIYGPTLGKLPKVYREDQVDARASPCLLWATLVDDREDAGNVGRVCGFPVNAGAHDYSGRPKHPRCPVLFRRVYELSTSRARKKFVSRRWDDPPALSLIFPTSRFRDRHLVNQSAASPQNLRFPGPKTQIPVGGGSNSHLALMHSGVFNMQCRPRGHASRTGRCRRPLPSVAAGRIESEAFRDCLPAEVGVTAADKLGGRPAEKGWYSDKFRKRYAFLRQTQRFDVITSFEDQIECRL